MLSRFYKKSPTAVVNSLVQSGSRPRTVKTHEVRYLLFVKKFTLGDKAKRSWFSVRSIFTRWTPLALATYTGYTLKYGFTENTTSLELQCYKRLPLRILSKMVGKLATVQVPVSLREPLFGMYCDWFDVNMEEAFMTRLDMYSSFQQFFTRNLDFTAREIDQKACLVSPCDGRVLSIGPLTSCRVEQIKGVTYSLQLFLGRTSWMHRTQYRDAENPKDSRKSRLYTNVLMEGIQEQETEFAVTDMRNDFRIRKSGFRHKNDDDYYKSILRDPANNMLYQCVIYLAPGDYHRFHSPCDWSVKLRRHFSGKLLSVNPMIAKLIPGLFCMNERAVYFGDWKHGFFSFTAVGATNVGSIRVYKDDSLRTNHRVKKRCEEVLIDPMMDYERGEIMGQFNLGSTIVLIFEAPKNFEFTKKAGDIVKMGMDFGSSKEVPVEVPKKSRWWF